MIKYLFVFFVSITKLGAQNLSPITMNSGGGFANNFEWSIAESVSIANFNVPGYLLNTGVLQPTDNVLKFTGTIEKDPFLNNIQLWPNPTVKLLNIKLNYAEIGDLSFQLIDVIGGVLLTQEVGTIYTTYEKSISIESLPAASYFLKVFFKPINQIAKTKVYKIIKL